jgi:hypothetical protein
MLLAVGPAHVAAAALVAGGGGQRADCLLQMSAEGVAFPAGKTPKGVSCGDGDVCDFDGQRNGVCLLSVSLCLNEATRSCQPREVSRATVKAKKKSPVDVTALQAALAAIPLPIGVATCTQATLLSVPLAGPNKKGVVPATQVVLKGVAKSGSRKDSDTYKLTCVPTTVAGVGTTTSTIVSTTTTTTLGPVPEGPPGAGLVSEITSAAVSPQGVVTVTFTLTDAMGVPLIPSTASTSNPAQARVQFTLAHLDPETSTTERQSVTFTRYRSYIVPNPGQPGFDSGGTLAALDAARGVYVYTFATMLPVGFPASVTHTVGGQVQRTDGDATLYANPLFDFVPSGGAVATRRQVTTTAQCNACHDPLAEHGGARREVGLCQLCHTDQGFDPQSGNSIELEQMIHRIHRGTTLPSVVDGAVGAKYEIIGFQNSATVFAEKVLACDGGALDGVRCGGDGDCPNGTCTGSTVTGVGFPQDIRSCAVCHTQGATAGDHLTKASTPACTGCHDDVNPSETATNAGAPGTHHAAGPQPEAFCATLCHTPGGAEFGLSVAGAHTVPERSSQLTGLMGELLSASGSPGGAVTIAFRLSDGAGTPLSSVAGLSSLALAISGPSTDFGALTPSYTTPALIGGSASGTLTGPDGSGVFAYTTTVGNGIPAGGTGTWRVGMEGRRSVTINGQSVSEAMQNVVRDFSIDGSAVAPRRAVVEQSKCGSCHGVFSQGFSIHGNSRNRVEYCVLCHNPSTSDFTRRVAVPGADPETQPIAFKHLLHKVHTGESLTQQPYIVYGFGPSAHDFGEVRFPGNRADCEQCHLSGTFLLPLPAGVLPTRVSEIVGGVDTTIGSIPPIQDACLACHDEPSTAAHAATNTASGGAEACATCHGEGAAVAVSVVHASAAP